MTTTLAVKSPPPVTDAATGIAGCPVNAGTLPSTIGAAPIGGGTSVSSTMNVDMAIPVLQKKQIPGGS